MRRGVDAKPDTSAHPRPRVSFKLERRSPLRRVLTGIWPRRGKANNLSLLLFHLYLTFPATRRICPRFWEDEIKIDKRRSPFARDSRRGWDRGGWIDPWIALRAENETVIFVRPVFGEVRGRRWWIMRVNHGWKYVFIFTYLFSF